MPRDVPPAQPEQIAPSSPAQGVVIRSSDQFSFDYILGKVLIGGSQFSDTLGRFFPFYVDSAKSLVINGSDAHLYGVRFHNTAVSSTDAVIYFADSGVLFVVPNQTGSIGNAAMFAVADRAASGYTGYVFYPGYAGGPRLYWTDGTNVNLVHAGGANYIYVTGAAAGFAPNIVAVGADLNINLPLTPKGTGVVYFNYAANAVGGGAAATLGTIGGTGPTTAGQNEWLKVNVNGNVRWIPTWA